MDEEAEAQIQTHKYVFIGPKQKSKSYMAFSDGCSFPYHIAFRQGWVEVGNERRGGTE